ncbi:hypothetical protein EJ-1p26 [Streptococcus phage EJ-1]|uniref:hypothetical protein n=1 Tax=Streptococcus phage EJ-1 TaxID=12402 RepID=UPI00002258C1|nr:hypothetical protein EJ-1p26 [Streptococcus phage EJ-1]CAE82108.1 hypothetical protein [Streptococcus phage EJ-1]
MIERLERLIGYGSRDYIERNEILNLVKQLDEPKPVKVPPFVADWYEKKKHDLNHYIWDYIYNWNHQEESEFKRWMNCSITTFQTLVNMHQFGYEVEKEKRYTVKIPKTDQYLHSRDNDFFFFVTYVRPDDDPHNCHTRKELKEAGFGWVFHCPGIEIEEVD